MAALDDLLDRVQDRALRADLEREIAPLRSDQSLGLVFERHLPERVRLHGQPIRRGLTVHVRTDAEQVDWRVVRVRGAVAELRRRDASGAVVEEEQPLEQLVVVREFGDPIYPGLRSVGTVERGGDKPFHTVIDAENYHALEALTYACEGQVDAIYIDPPYNTGARDWKYNNDYVDGDDAYRHSKWLAMMERRLEARQAPHEPARLRPDRLDRRERAAPAGAADRAHLPVEQGADGHRAHQSGRCLDHRPVLARGRAAAVRARRRGAADPHRDRHHAGHVHRRGRRRETQAIPVGAVPALGRQLPPRGHESEVLPRLHRRGGRPHRRLRGFASARRRPRRRPSAAGRLRRAVADQAGRVGGLLAAVPGDVPPVPGGWPRAPRPQERQKLPLGHLVPDEGPHARDRGGRAGRERSRRRRRADRGERRGPPPQSGREDDVDARRLQRDRARIDALAQVPAAAQVPVPQVAVRARGRAALLRRREAGRARARLLRRLGDDRARRPAPEPGGRRPSPQHPRHQQRGLGAGGHVAGEQGAPSHGRRVASGSASSS